MVLKFDNRGQTIIEGVVALAAIVIILAAISVAISTSVTNSQYIKQQTLATKYSQTGIEQIRYLRNNNPAAFAAISSSSQTYCFNVVDSIVTFVETPSNYITANSSCVTTVNIPTDSLRRLITFNPNSPADCSLGTRVTVTTSWSSGKCSSTNRYCHDAKIVSCLADQPESGRSL